MTYRLARYIASATIDVKGRYSVRVRERTTWTV